MCYKSAVGRVQLDAVLVEMIGGGMQRRATEAPLHSRQWMAVTLQRWNLLGADVVPTFFRSSFDAPRRGAGVPTFTGLLTFS